MNAISLFLVFKYIYFSNCIISSFLIVIVDLQESKGIFEWCKMIVFVAYCFLHQYLNSFFGQELIDKVFEIVLCVSIDVIFKAICFFRFTKL